jgi:flagellar protein FlaG
MILFIASMLIAASVAGVFTDTVGQLSSAIDDQGLQVSEDVRTDVEIISDSGAGGIYDAATDVVTLHVKNTGSETLAPEGQAINAFVDGRFVAPGNVTVTLVGGDTSWRPGGVVRVELDGQDLTGDVRVKLVVNGDEEVFEFRS